jgi:REP element-mobilizing transposase RayT
MGRPHRNFEIGVPYHIAHRGNRQMRLFESDIDRRFYLAMLGSLARRHGIRVGGFCLMTNHVHFAVIPDCVKGISRASDSCISATPKCSTRETGGGDAAGKAASMPAVWTRSTRGTRCATSSAIQFRPAWSRTRLTGFGRVLGCTAGIQRNGASSTST